MEIYLKDLIGLPAVGIKGNIVYHKDMEVSKYLKG